MNPTWEDPIPDEDDDESAFDKGFVQGRDAVIFLIDATKEMFDKLDDEVAFHLCLKCARTTLTNKIISSNKDLTGVVIFGTEKTKNSRNTTDFKHTYIFQDLGEPGAERILEVEELMTLNESTFTERYGHSYDFSLADALWVCGIMFSKCSVKLANKRILLFTSNDSPHEGNSQLQLQARTKARDLHESGVEINLMHIQRPSTIFDCSRFYKDISFAADDEYCKLPDPSEKFDDLLLRVRSKDHKKRPLGSLTFSLGGEVNIALKMYKLVVPTTKPANAKLSKENNAELKVLTKTFLSDTGEILLPSDLKKYQEYGGRKIYITDDEVKQIRHFDKPGLVLMGFKPNSCVKTHHHIKPCVFLYPDEKAIQGSTRLFLALLLQCQKRGYVPICRMIARQNDPPKFVALLPQEEQLDDRGIQTVPPGFHVVFFPFMEDIRNIKGEAKQKPSENLIEKAKDIIKKLQFAYHPESFENPVLQKHWRNIEALALNRDAPDEIIDYTLPTKDVIEKRAGKLIDEFKALLCPGGSDSGGEKRGMGTSYGSPAKRARVDNSEIPMNLLHETSTGQLGRYKVNVLKEFCKRNGIRCGSKKAEIIDAIKEYYEA